MVFLRILRGFCPTYDRMNLFPFQLIGCTFPLFLHPSPALFNSMTVDLQLPQLHVLWNFAVIGFARLLWSRLKRSRINWRPLIRCPPQAAQTNSTSGHAYNVNKENATLVFRVPCEYLFTDTSSVRVGSMGSQNVTTAVPMDWIASCPQKSRKLLGFCPAMKGNASCH